VVRGKDFYVYQHGIGSFYRELRNELALLEDNQVRGENENVVLSKWGSTNYSEAACRLGSK